MLLVPRWGLVLVRFVSLEQHAFGGAMGFSFGTPASEAATAPEPSVYAAPAPVAAAERSLPAHGEDLPPRRERRYTLGDLINGIAH